MQRTVLLISVAVSAVMAIQAQSVSLDSCRSWARANYPTVRQYELVQKSEQYSVSNAARAWIPQIRFSAQATWQTDAASFPEELTGMLAAMGSDIKGMRQDQYKIALDLQQNIWDGGKSTADKKIAQAQAQADRLSADIDLYALESRIDNLYFGILLLDGQTEQMENRIALLRENMRRCQVMADNSVLLQSDVDAVEVEVLTAGQKLEQMRYSREAYREMLSLLTGKDLRQAELTMPAEQEVSLNTESHRPELQLFAARSSILQAQERSVKSASMPQFALFAQGWYGYPGLNMFENMKNANWSLNAIVGVRMIWNIGAYYTQSNRLNQLRIGQQQVQVQRDVFAFNNTMQRTQENSEIIRLRRALQDDDRIIELRRSVREAAETKHENGTIGTTELLQAITDESTAQSAQTLHQIELLKKTYELKHTINN